MAAKKSKGERAKGQAKKGGWSAERIVASLGTRFALEQDALVRAAKRTREELLPWLREAASGAAGEARRNAGLLLLAGRAERVFFLETGDQTALAACLPAAFGEAARDLRVPLFS